MILTGKATDLGSGISYYQFSTNGNLTANSSGWISITNTTKEITQTYTVVNNGTYYFYVKDAAGNVNKKSIVISNIRYVAQIGDVKYRTLREAIEAVKTDETILMIGDTTENNTVPEDKKFTLDLGEQTITGGIINNGEMIIEGEGTITTDLGNILENNGTLTIESGNYIKTDNSDNQTTSQKTVIKNYGITTINGGYFNRTCNGWTVQNLGIFYFNNGNICLDADGDGTALYNTSGTIEMTGGNIYSKEFGLTIHGGNVKTTGGNIKAEWISVLVENTGKGFFVNTSITCNVTAAIHNATNSYSNCIIKNRNTNYGITGAVGGKVKATTNTGPGQSSEKLTLYNTGYTHLLFPTWTVYNGQDDIIWMKSQSNSQTHTITIEKSQHNNETGTYEVHTYIATSDGNWNTDSSKLITGTTLEF